MKTRVPSTNKAFTLIELLVVIAIIAVLAGIALPVFSEVQVKGAQTKALSNAKQIGLACKLFATDNSGRFPYSQFDFSAQAPGTANLTSSNDAFRNLMPDYCQSEAIFWVAKSAFCDPQPPDEQSDTQSNRLKAGEVHWAYVQGLTDTSNPAFPLIADGFASPSQFTYSTDETAEGGVWKGKRAIVVRADTSANLERVNRSTLTVPGGTTNATLFTPGPNWLGNTQTPLNPE